MALYVSALEAGYASGRGLQEETLRAVGALVVLLGARFAAFLATFWPALARAMEDAEYPQVCTTALAVFRHVAAALGKGVLPHADQAQTIVQHLLRDPGISPELRAPAAASLGSLCLAVGGESARLGEALDGLRAAGIAVTANGRRPKNLGAVGPRQAGPKRICSQRAPDSWLLRRELTSAVLEAYEMVVRSLGAAGRLEALRGHLSALIDFLTFCAASRRADEASLARCLLILGALAEAMPGGLATFCWCDEDGCVTKLVGLGSTSTSPDLRRAATVIAALRDA